MKVEIGNVYRMSTDSTDKGLRWLIISSQYVLFFRQGNSLTISSNTTEDIYAAVKREDLELL